MGAAPAILPETRLTPQQARENERQWFLDAFTGELKPEESSGEDPQERPKPVLVARWTFD
ncbi:hypothetical protein ACIBJF_47715 [Streptomyces sp. NPDC050743]|uniref:hypothetical protein n=1 Tax=Streptomyces sp. NPDC050743 TaxID=3365634 RepID=UPI003797A93C